MLKTMLFIDGSWLYKGQFKLAEEYDGDTDYRIDYQKLPSVFSVVLTEEMGVDEIDIVRTYIFGSVPFNYDSRDVALADIQNNFYRFLRGISLRS